MATTAARLSADEFLVHPAAQGPSELVRGEIRLMTPASDRHGVVAGNVHGLLWAHVRARRLGRCYPDNVGFRLPIPGQTADTVRAPDAAFLSLGRMSPRVAAHGFVPTAPDLAVEVVSPSATASALHEKLDDYLAAGTAVVWVIDPERRTVEVHTPDAAVRRLREGDALDGAPVLPDFRCAVAELFEGLDAD